MIIFYLYYIIIFNLFFFVNANYVTTNKIMTKFKEKNTIINLMTNPYFYYKYLHAVKASNIEFKPKIKELYSEINFPQSITYYSTPKISFLPSSITKMKIQQQWDRNEDKFIGNIKTKYLEFNITIEPVLTSEKYSLYFTGTIIKKNFFIPQKYLDQILQDFGNIFTKISELNNL